LKRPSKVYVKEGRTLRIQFKNLYRFDIKVILDPQKKNLRLMIKEIVLAARMSQFTLNKGQRKLESTIKKNLEHLDFKLKRGDFGQRALIPKNLITIFPFCRRIPNGIGEDQGAESPKNRAGNAVFEWKTV
jgi:hypothetical protein